MGPGSRHAHTTSFIREAIVDELVENGHATLTMEAIALRSFSSIGSVYARYPNRIAAVSDVLEFTVQPGLASSLACSGWEETVGKMLSDEHTRRLLCSLVEIALCSRHEPELTNAGPALVSIIRDGASTLSADAQIDEGLRWLLSCVIVGQIVLTSIGCAVPTIDESLIALVKRAALAQPDKSKLHTRGKPSVSRPESPEPCRTDETGRELTIAATVELAEHGASRANIRRIARRIGVTTGAVYRRFGSKNDLVREALVRELGPERYAWTERLADSVTGEHAEVDPGDVLADQMFSLINDRTRLLSTLEMIHAARGDKTVRETLVNQFEDAATARAGFFETIGVNQTDITPESMGWVIQLAPTGARVLVAVGDRPNEAPVREALRRVMIAAGGR